MVNKCIYANESSVAQNVEIGVGSSIIATEVVIEEGVRIGKNVQITCDKLFIGKNSKIAAESILKAPDILISDNCSIGRELNAEFNQYFQMGRCSAIGKQVQMFGQGFKCGEFLWMKDQIIIGGGGSKGPNSFLHIGDETTIIDRCYINLSEAVHIGSNTALSMGVSLITHAAWQPALEGYTTKFGGISIGDNSVVFLNCSIMPGITIGSNATIGAHSVVTQDIPDFCLAAGAPAKVKRGPGEYPQTLTAEQKDSLAEDIINDYLTTLASKGVELSAATLDEQGRVSVFIEDQSIVIALYKSDCSVTNEVNADISISLGSLPSSLQGTCHFDLNGLTMFGKASALSEDLRDYLRRRAIKINTGEPFKVLPLSNLARLNRLRQELQHETI